MSPWRVTYLLVLVSTFAASAYSASFDCSKSAGNIEKLVCSNPRLSQLDETLAILYKKALAESPVPDDSREQQRNWIKGWRDSCKDASCLENAYTSRLSELKRDLRHLPFKPSFERPLLFFPALAPTKGEPRVVKKEPLEVTGRIEFNHDAAGGKYDISSGKTYYTIRYVWDTTDEQREMLTKLQESNQYVVLRGQLASYRDGSKGIDGESVVTIFGDRPNYFPVQNTDG